MADHFVIVIPTAGKRPDLLRRTLLSLGQCVKPPIYRCTIVIENGTRGATEDIVHQYGGALSAQYVFHPAASKSGALNAAMERIPDGLVYFADDDVRVHPLTLMIYADAARGVRAGQFFGGPCGVDYEEAPPEWLLKYLPGSARGWSWDDAPEPVMKPCFLGFNWAAFAADIVRAGGFDEGQGPGLDTVTSVGDETDMQLRLLSTGCSGRYLPPAWVWHYVPKERSSAEWALQRKYSMAVASGISAARRGLRHSYMYYLLRLWGAAPMYALLSRASGDSTIRFHAQVSYRSRSGFVAGIRLARSRGMHVS